MCFLVSRILECLSPLPDCVIKQCRKPSRVDLCYRGARSVRICLGLDLFDSKVGGRIEAGLVQGTSFRPGRNPILTVGAAFLGLTVG
jgi:hypothetical protein